MRLSPVLPTGTCCPTLRRCFGVATRLFQLAIGLTASAALSHAATAEATATFRAKVEPLLKKYCYECHGDSMDKGGVAFDGFETTEALVGKHSLWLAALRNVRAGMMPPNEEGIERPTADEIAQLSNWIKYQALGIDPANPDPGRVTVRRLNRVEYRNTIRDLMGFDFNAEAEFPPDDSGHGFDNNGDVLTISPLLVEKYLAAAGTIVERAVPKVSHVMRERIASGREFRGENDRGNGEQMNAKQAAKVSRTFKIDQAEKHQLVVELEVRGSFDFDPSRCQVICRVDGEERFTETVAWSERKTLRHEYDVTWAAGDHEVSFEIVPLPPVETPEVNIAHGGSPSTPASSAARVAATAPTSLGTTAATPATPRSDRQRPATSVNIRIASVQVRGPVAREFWITPENYSRFFPDGAAPEEPAARDRYAHDLLQRFATRAFRRPIDEARLNQLVGLARGVYTQSGRTFEEGIARAMMAVLASPRFLFRVEAPEPALAAQPIAPVDEFALASRLSYFFWSTMPDDELFALAERGQLRRELGAQVTRMLKDARSQAFTKNFTGQWLQVRDVESLPINLRAVFGMTGAPSVLRNRDGRPDFDGTWRRLLRSETEAYFEHVLREDRSLLELIDSNYTFLNEKLATFYGVPDVTGESLRRVELPADSVRGGILTQAGVLTVTSNPTRTSPVKRGLFVLENILGTPPPPPPPDVPDLEESKKEFAGREPKLSEMLAVHRANAMCRSCHQRMDPLGLAMENFNAIGAWRDTEARQPIEAGGQLITGEAFADVRELKKILVTKRRTDFYRCITEKLLTYALGRGIEHHDMHTIDEIVSALERENGKISVLVMGVVNSAPFQKQRTAAGAAANVSASGQ